MNINPKPKGGLSMKKSISGKKRKWKSKVVNKREVLKQQQEFAEIDNIDIQVSLIQALIPIGLKAVEDRLQREVQKWAGERYRHGKEYTRWGKQNGSVYLHDQKIPIEVPRVRDKKRQREIQLETYQKLQEPYKLDQKLFQKVLNGLSMHRYEESAGLSAEVFGVSASSVSKKFKKVTGRKLRHLQSRNLAGYDFMCLFVDGKRFAEDGIMVALGITADGKKVILGIEQMGTENYRAISQFFNKLIERGFDYNQGILCVIDGAKGLKKAIKQIYRDKAKIQRCQWHKRENVVSYLNKSQQTLWRSKLQKAYMQETYAKAKQSLDKITEQLEHINPSAASSLREGLEETLTVHKLGLYPQLGKSFCTSNMIESVMAQVEQYTYRVDRWRNGTHRQRWVASGLLELEPRLRRVRGYKHLPELRKKLKQSLKNSIEIEPTEMAVQGGG